MKLSLKKLMFFLCLWPTIVSAELLFKPSIDGFRGEWNLAWDDPNVTNTLSSTALRQMTFRFRGKKSFEIVDFFGFARIKGTTTKRKNKLELVGAYRIARDQSENDQLLESVFQSKSGKKDLTLTMDVDNNLEVSGRIVGLADIHSFTLKRIEVEGRSTSLIKNIKFFPKKVAPGSLASVKIDLRNLGQVAMGWGLAFDVMFPVDIPVENIIVSSSDQTNLIGCDHGPPFALLNTLNCRTENLGPKKFSASLIFSMVVPENYSSKKFRLKVKAFSPNSFQKVKKDSFRKILKIRSGKDAQCKANPKITRQRCDLAGGSGLGFSIGCGAIEASDRRFVVAYHGKVRDPLDETNENRLDKFTLLCARNSSLCSSLKQFGSSGYVVSALELGAACEEIARRCTNSLDIQACNL